MKKINLLFLLIATGLLFSCADNNSIGPAGDNGLVADSSRIIRINDFTVQLSANGIISDGVWNSGNPVPVVFMAGLWIGIENNGNSNGNVVTTSAIPYSNYTSKWGGDHPGVYALTAGNQYEPEKWPVKYGAPVDAAGSPRIYGDGMLWTSMQSDTAIKSPAVFSKPVKGLRVTQAVYEYKKDDLRNVIFVKYGVTNMSTENLNNVYLGFFSDTDLNNSAFNRTGYDSSRAISYTYDTTANYVTGFSFLETPKNTAVKSHRIMRKNNYINPEFGENSFTEPEQIIYALKGLSNSGQPMINPVTGAATEFAFTGDPVSRTGWLDTPVDVRSLISAGPFNLSPGETTWVTLAWVVNKDTSLEKSLTKLKSQMDQIRSETDLWQFH